MSKTRRRLIIYFSILNGSLLVLTALFLLLFGPPKLAGFLLAEDGGCAFQDLFGLYCPGCGGTRAVESLVKLDLIGAFRYYPPIYIGLFLIIYMNVIYIVCFVKDDGSLLEDHRYYEFIILPSAVVFLFVLRNVLLLSGIDPLGDFEGRVGMLPFLETIMNIPNRLRDILPF